MTHRQSVDSTGTKFFTKYSDVNQLNQKERSRFRSTFQASKLGDQDKMNEIQDMFNNYNLFKYGQYGSGSKKRKSFAQGTRNKDVESMNRFKNMKERVKDNENLKVRLQSLKNERQGLFDKMYTITKKQRK